VTNTRQGLGCGSVPFEFYKEFQVKTGGFSAEFGRSTGGLLNAVTKSGGNEWEFSAAAYYSPGAWYADGQVSRGDGSTGQIFRDDRNSEVQQSELILTVGGPIIKDHLFIYALVNPRDNQNDFSWATGTVQYSAVTEFRKRESSGSDNLFWGLKLDWQITDGHSVGFFAYSDRNDATEEVYRYNPEDQEIGDLTGGFLRKRGGEAWNVTYTGYFTDNFTVSAMAGEIKTEYTTDPLNLVCPSVVDTRDLPAELLAEGCGPGGSIGDNNDSNEQVRLDFNYEIGNHQLKAGLDYQDRASTRESAPPTENWRDPNAAAH
jgi:hypothetical protein